MNEKSRNAPLRIYLLILSFSLLFIFVTKAQTKVQTTSPIHTKQGDIIGNVHADNTIQWKEYLGIPYAEPPIDNLRWAPPLPLTSFPQNPLKFSLFTLQEHKRKNIHNNQIVQQNMEKFVCN